MAWKTAGLEPITLHEARHTFASLMIAAGVNAKALATYMGHASARLRSIAMTISCRATRSAPQANPLFTRNSALSERRRNRTFQAWGCHALPVLKTGWATRPMPLHDRV
jgi:integrase